MHKGGLTHTYNYYIKLYIDNPISSCGNGYAGLSKSWFMHCFSKIEDHNKSTLKEFIENLYSNGPNEVGKY